MLWLTSLFQVSWAEGVGDLQVGSLLGQVSGISDIKVMKLVLELSGKDAFLDFRRPWIQSRC